MYYELKKKVFEANISLPKYNLVTFTWGNVSGIDRNKEVVAIKPSGVKYEDMTIDNIVILDLNTGKQIEGDLKPSSDAPTHLELYRAFANIGGIVHTHSRWATIYAQAKKNILPLGTTHADYFYGEIPCTREMSKEEIDNNYEKETGVVIIEEFQDKNPDNMPAVLVANHGPFTWGKDVEEALHNAVVLEEVAMMAFHSTTLKSMSIEPMKQDLLDKHYFRKHGKNAYYGQ